MDLRPMNHHYLLQALATDSGLFEQPPGSIGEELDQGGQSRVG